MALDSEDRGPGLRAFLIVMIVLTILSITLRFWSRSLNSPRGRRMSRFWWDDWASLASVPFVLTQFALVLAMIHIGLGVHVNTLPKEIVYQNLKLLFVAYFNYDIGLYLTKTSALLFYSRIFTKYQHVTWFNYTLYAVHALNTFWLLGIIFGTIFMCHPVSKNWITDEDGECGSTGALWLGSAIPSVVIDLIILLLPLPKIWFLQMSRARKSGITVVFMIGYCVIIVSLGRLITVIKSAAALSADITYEGVPALYWLCAESPITLFSICLPAMLPLGRYLANNYFSPLMSRISSLLSSNGSCSGLRSRNGDFQKVQPDPSGIRMRAVNRSGKFRDTTEGDIESVQSIASSRKILHLSPNQHNHEASAHGGNPGNHDVPDQAIRVDNDINVSW
ncbi:hypothetical protein F4818DRAFT_428963 [Hypoxylon cercidicola]|nr:hypothetical protein F4818DRAFT_428963 [Hypoxylon cercidicola]